MLLLLCLALRCSLSAANFEADAPETASRLREFLQSDPFTSAVHACFPNASSPFPLFGEAPNNPSHCFVNEQPLEELAMQLGGSIASAEILRELEFISLGAYSPQLLWDLDMEIGGFFRTWISVFYKGNQFMHGHKPGAIRPRLWLTPSPIGRMTMLGADNAGGPEIRLGETCSNTNTEGLVALQLDPELDENRRARDPRRQLLDAYTHSSPSTQANVSQLLVSARIVESSPTEVTGAGEVREQNLWENQVAMENVEQTDQTSPGPPYPRNHMLLFYRADWFEALNISVPDSWDELISLAEALPRLSGFQGSSRAAGPEDYPGWNMDAWPGVEFTPVEPVELLQGLPAEEMSPRERAQTNSSLPRYALCLDLAPNCKGGWIFNAILASLAQSRGTWQGAFMDPISTDLLGETEPVLVEEALRIFSRLTRSAAHQPSSAQSCALVNPMFAAGACAMALDWDLAFPYVYNKPVLSSTPPGQSSPYAQELVGKVGVAPLPGSTRVYDRSTASIVDCNEAACPLSTKHAVTEYAVQEGEAAGAGSARDLQQQTNNELGSWEDAGVCMAWSEVLVNRAPLSANTFADAFFCNTRRDESGKPLFGLNIRALDATSRVISGMLLPMLNLEIFRGQVLESALKAMGPEVMHQAYRLIGKQHVTGLDGLYQVHPALATPPSFSSEELKSWWAPNTTRLIPGLSALTHMYLDDKDSSRYFDALWRARYSYRNQAPDLWTTRTLNLAYRHAAEEVSVYTVASPDFSLEAATQGFQKRCREARASEPSNMDTVQQAIWYTTGFNEGMISRPEEEEAEDRDWVAGAIAGPVVAFVLLCICACLVFATILWLRKKHRSWLGHRKAPGVGPGTTMLHTDIEGSTPMWEALPETVCDRALMVHNQVIRAMLDKHAGYECGTEGDAFLLAFHTVPDAVLFASEAQLQLLLAPWPKELLQLDACRPVYVQPSTGAPLFQPMWHSSHKGSSSSLHAMGSSPYNLQPSFADGSVPTPDSVSRGGLLPSPSFAAERKQSLVTPLPSPHAAALQRTSTITASTPVHNSNPLPTVLVEKQGPKSSRASVGSFVGSMLRAKRSKTDSTLSGSLEQRESALSKALQRPLTTSQRPGGGPTQSAYHDAARRELEKRQSGLSGLLCLDVALLEAFLSGFARDIGGASDVQDYAGDPDRAIHRTHSDSCTFNPCMGPTARSSTLLDRPRRSLEAEWPAPEASSQLPLYNPNVGQRLQASMPVVDGPGEGRLLVFRGLRVRMGMASGMQRAEDVVLNKAQGRVEYKGRVTEATRAIVNAANGGQILMSAETFQQLPSAARQGRVLVAAMGDHVFQLGSEDVTLQLYQALPYLLCARAAIFGPVRWARQLSLGFTEAPSDKAAICFMHVCFFSVLQMWNPGVADAALKIWSDIARRALAERGGYLVEGAGSLCLAAFTRPASAIRWALDVLEECLHADWPEELLMTEFGETHSIVQPSIVGRPEDLPPIATVLGQHFPVKRTRSQQDVVVEEKVLFRGLRIKIGIDWGSVMADLHPASGRVSYRGKVMNRAARISSMAKCGQVLCSELAWNSASPELSATAASPALRGSSAGSEHGEREVAASHLGSFKLKGIQEMINIFQCN